MEEQLAPQPPITTPLPSPMPPPTQPLPPLSTTPTPPPTINTQVTPTQITSQANTSGMGNETIVPEEIKGWSWGGFLWNWIWALGNKTWIGVLGIIPIVNLIISFILGVRGREWAWRNKKWDSVESFNKTQRNWTKWWLIINIPLILLGIIGIIITFVIASIDPRRQMDLANCVKECPTTNDSKTCIQSCQNKFQTPSEDAPSQLPSETSCKIIWTKPNLPEIGTTQPMFFKEPDGIAGTGYEAIGRRKVTEDGYISFDLVTNFLPIDNSPYYLYALTVNSENNICSQYNLGTLEQIPSVGTWIAGPYSLQIDNVNDAQIFVITQKGFGSNQSDEIDSLNNQSIILQGSFGNSD